MAIIRSPQWWWNYFKNLFGLNDFSRGGISLSTGWHEIFVPTTCTPVAVRLRQMEGPIQCCGGDISMMATCIQADGFILYADVKTDYCDIEWTVEYPDNCPKPPDVFGFR